MSPLSQKELLLFERLSLTIKTKFKQFLLVFDKTEPVRRTIKQCKAVMNRLQIFFRFL